MAFTREGTSLNRDITVLLSGTVAIGDVLQIDPTASGDARYYTMKKSATNALGQPLSAAVALEAGVAGDRIRARVEGIVSANSTGLVQDDVCVVDATAGRLEDYVPADHNAPVFAIAMGATSSNLTDVLLINPFKL